MFAYVREETCLFIPTQELNIKLRVCIGGGLGNSAIWKMIIFKKWSPKIGSLNLFLKSQKHFLRKSIAFRTPLWIDARDMWTLSSLHPPQVLQWPQSQVFTIITQGFPSPLFFYHPQWKKIKIHSFGCFFKISILDFAHPPLTLFVRN